MMFSFASIVFGRPCSIRDADSEVSMPKGLGGATVTHPYLSSLETLADGRREKVTTFSYQRYKYRLYKIASAITGEIYFDHGSSFAMVATKVQHIHDQLITWFADLPQELRLGGTFAETFVQEPNHSSIETTFRLQALALQLAYDNIQILLHRPLLSYNNDALTPQKLSDPLVSETARRRLDGHRSGSGTPDSPVTIFTLSKNQCWESAYRTSTLSQHDTLLRKALETHAASYIGIHMFTAGTVLSIVALSRPLSSRAQVCKRAIARIIRVSHLLSRRNKLCAQSKQILEEFVKILLAKEMAIILPDDDQCSQRAHLHATSTEKAAAVSTMPSQDPRTEVVDKDGEIALHDQYFAFSNPNFDASTQYDVVSLDNIDLNEGISSMRQGLSSSLRQIFFLQR